jgi:hypothetical protein
MEDLAMLRKFLLLSLLLAAASAMGNDLEALLRARYTALNDAILRRDSKAAEQWVAKFCTPSFLYISKDKHRWDRRGFRQGLLDQMKMTQKVAKSVIRLGKPQIAGAKATVSFANDFEGTVKFDGREFRLVDSTVTSDVWVKVGNDWKLSRVSQTKADTQMYQKQ